MNQPLTNTDKNLIGKQGETHQTQKLADKKQDLNQAATIEDSNAKKVNIPPKKAQLVQKKQVNVSTKQKQSKQINQIPQTKNANDDGQVFQQDLSSDQQKNNQFQFDIFKTPSKKLIQQKQLEPIIKQKQQKQKDIPNSPKQPHKTEKQKIYHMTSSINSNQKVESRKIPERLLQSYQQVVLPKTEKKNTNTKSDTKKQKNIIAFQQNKNLPIDEQMLASLPIVQGHCSLKLENENLKQTKYIIIKQTIVFQQQKRILIKNIQKIKIFQKNYQYFIKFCLQNGPKESQVVLLTVFANQNAKFAIFYKTFQFFANIILRKMLLKSIVINQETQKFQKDQPVQYDNQLFRKSQFFSSWQKRKMKLQNNILSTFKGDKCSNQLKSIRQLWTRFDMMYGYLIIKIWHRYQKIQFGIPLCDFTVIDGKANWLYGLIRLVKQRQDQN